MKGASLEVEALELCYGRLFVLGDFSFSLAPGEIGCLLGGSGCGKSSLLRAIGGFEPPIAGTIRIDGKLVSSAQYILEPEKRGIGMVFQDYALFPHLSVAENIACGLKRMEAAQLSQRIRQELDRVGLSHCADLYPHQLSGGQKQRVAIARTLANRPCVLLMDEPFSNLDPELRDILRHDLHDLLKESGITCLLVTHDQTDAFALADKLGVIYSGRLMQWDTPYSIYHTPNNEYVADFVGEGVFLPGQAHQDGVYTELGNINGKVARHLVGSPVRVLLRPEDLVHDDDSAKSLPIASRIFRGDRFLYTLRLPSGNTILASVLSHHNRCIGDQLGFRLEMDHLVIFATP